MERKLEVGAAVIFIDTHYQRHNALVEVVHGAEVSAPDLDAFKVAAKEGRVPCCNVLYLSGDPEKRDQHGRQKERGSSVSHGSQQNPANLGYCWVWPDELK